MTVHVPGPQPLRVLVAGPSADTQGGMATVQRLLERWVGERSTGTPVALDVVVTHVEGGAGARAWVMVTGVLGALRRILAGRVDLVHVHLSKRSSVLRKGAILLVARFRGTPTVVHAHAGLFPEWFDGLPGAARAVVRQLLVADRVVVLSEASREDYAGRLATPPSRIVVVPNPVEWPDTVGERDMAGPVVGVFLGRLTAQKGIDDLVTAVGRLPAEQRDRFRLVAAGHGEADRVRTMVARAGLDDIVEVRTWIGAEERDALLARAQLLVLPSTFEGMPMSVLEAMAWGVTPVVTPVGGLATLVRDGENGVVVPVGDPDALATALAKLVADDALRVALGRRARADVRMYAADAWATRLTDMWSSLAR